MWWFCAYFFEFHSTAHTGLWKKGGGAKLSITARKGKKISKDVRFISRLLINKRCFGV